MTILNNQNFFDFIKEGYTIVDMYADWCGPCRALAPIFEKLSQKYGDKIKFAKFDVDKDEGYQISQKYSVMSIPCVIVFKDGEEIHRFIGLQPESAYTDYINSLQ